MNVKLLWHASLAGLALAATICPVSASDQDPHQKCLEATDYEGCIKVQNAKNANPDGSPEGPIRSLVIRGMTGAHPDPRIIIYWKGDITNLPCVKEDSVFACG